MKYLLMILTMLLTSCITPTPQNLPKSKIAQMLDESETEAPVACKLNNNVDWAIKDARYWATVKLDRRGNFMVSRRFPADNNLSSFAEQATFPDEECMKREDGPWLCCARAELK